jgi:hypothetical protein
MRERERRRQGEREREREGKLQSNVWWQMRS